jgi:hypothetical protein
MRVLLRLVLDCSADEAWDLIRSPTAFRAAASPLLQFESLEAGGFPARWPGGPHRVRVSLFGTIPVGSQRIDLSFDTRPNGVRITRDTGGGLTGAFTVIRRWRHSMAVSPLPDGRTLYRDQLEFSAGILSIPAWVGLWAFWQWRSLRIRQQARRSQRHA